MNSPDKFQAMLLRLPTINSNRLVTVHSTGDTLEMKLDGSPSLISSVVDCNGSVVKSAHSWLSSLGRQVGLSFSHKTIEQYGRTVSYLVRWIEVSPPYPSLDIDGNIKLLNRSDVVNCLNAMKDQGAKEKTLHSREACLKQLLDWLTTKEGGLLRSSQDSPWGRDGSLRYVTATPHPLSPKAISTEIVVAVLNGMHNECERCMFHGQYDIGLRISELVDLTAGDIPNEDQYNPLYEFIPMCISGVKGRAETKKERPALISRAVLKRIKRYHSSLEYRLAPDWEINDPDKPAFLTVNQRKWSVRNASKQFKNSVRRLGMDDELKTHWMRHGTAYSVLQSDLAKTFQDRMLIIQKMLGHSSLRTTEIYTQIEPALLANLMKAGKQLDRLGEAELIRAETYLAPLKHKEKRGHRE